MAEEAVKLVVVDEANGKFIVNEGWRPIAKGLIEKYTELKHIAPDSLVFIDNISDTGKSRNIFRFANTNKVPPKWSDVLHQMYLEFVGELKSEGDDDIPTEDEWRSDLEREDYLYPDDKEGKIGGSV